MSKELNEAELFSIKRLSAKKVPVWDIADRIGISEEMVKKILKLQQNCNNYFTKNPQLIDYHTIKTK